MRNIYDVLKDLDIAYDVYEHPAVFTVEEADIVCGQIPGKQAKNLFLTNEKGTRHFLVTIGHDRRADLGKLAALFGEKRLRFASPERLMEYLGLTPGSVSPCGLINDETGAVEFFISRDLADQEKLYIHPNINTATLGIAMDDFRKFLAHLGHDMKIFDE
jgi:Ala-tRNA(Pro) deacylase